MELFFDKEGKPISAQQFEELLRQRDYCRVAHDHIGPYTVSTVWLGVDYGFGRLPKPLIFETMVFLGWGEEDTCGMAMHQDRYFTEEEALKGHNEVITLIHATLQTDERAITDDVQHQVLGLDSKDEGQGQVRDMPEDV